MITAEPGVTNLDTQKNSKVEVADWKALHLGRTGKSWRPVDSVMRRLGK